MARRTDVTELKAVKVRPLKSIPALSHDSPTRHEYVKFVRKHLKHDSTIHFAYSTLRTATKARI